MKKLLLKLITVILILFTGLFAKAQSSRWSLGADAGVGYYANIGVWSLKYSNSIDFKIYDRFSLSGNLGFNQSLVDFQTTPGVNNTLSIMLVDCNANYCLFKTKQSNSLWIGVGLSYFRGGELMENSYPVATRFEGTNINTMGFNINVKFKHKLSHRLLGSINLESRSMVNFFDPDNLLISLGYGVLYTL